MKTNMLFAGVWILSALALSACDKDASRAATGSEDRDPVLGVTKGLVGRGIADAAQFTAGGATVAAADGAAVFEDENILWFDPLTREIWFEGVEPAENFAPYEAIAFELDGEVLFTAATMVNPTSSRIIADLVLYVELDEGYRYYLNDGYPLWAGLTEEGLANAAARAEGWNKFLEHLAADGRLTEPDIPGTGSGSATDPVAGDTDDDGGPIELTSYEPSEAWQWNELQVNELYTVRSEQQLEELITEGTYTPSGIDFGKNTLLLVRVLTPNGIYNVDYALFGDAQGYDYRMKVIMNEAEVIGDVIVGTLAPAIPQDVPVSFDIVLTHEMD